MDIREHTEPQPEVAPPVGSIAPSLNPQPEIEHAPPDWSLWLLPLVALMLLAGAVAIYLLPTNMDLFAPLSYGLVLATLLLVGVAWRTISILMSPLSNAARRTPEGELITWNRFTYLISLVLASILLAALATGGMLIFVLDTPQVYGVGRQFHQPFVLAITSAVVILLLLFAWLVRIRPLQKLLQLRFAGAGVLVIPVVVYLALNSWSPSMFDDVYGDRSTYTGPVASWPAMLQFARHEVDRIDKDAILYDVSAYIIAAYSPPFHGPYSPQTSLFSVQFRFMRPTKEAINISLLDTNPIRLQSVTKESQALVSSVEYAYKRYADWLAYLKIGPREVYSLTEKEAIAFAQQYNLDFAEFILGPDTSLTDDGAESTQYGVPAVWDMHYISRDTYESLDLYVDGTTGEVLFRRPYLHNGTATKPSASRNCVAHSLECVQNASSK